METEPGRTEIETGEPARMSDDQYREAVEHLAQAPRQQPRGMSELVVRSWKLPDAMLSPEDQRLQRAVRQETFKRLGWDKRRSATLPETNE